MTGDVFGGGDTLISLLAASGLQLVLELGPVEVTSCNMTSIRKVLNWLSNHSGSEAE